MQVCLHYEVSTIVLFLKLILSLYVEVGQSLLAGSRSIQYQVQKTCRPDYERMLSISKQIILSCF